MKFLIISLQFSRLSVIVTIFSSFGFAKGKPKEIVFASVCQLCVTYLMSKSVARDKETIYIKTGNTTRRHNYGGEETGWVLEKVYESFKEMM